MATLPLGTYTQATQNIPASPGVTLGRFFGVGSLAPLQPALHCTAVQYSPSPEGPSWGPEGPSWGSKGPSWGSKGPPWGSKGPSWGSEGPS